MSAQPSDQPRAKGFLDTEPPPFDVRVQRSSQSTTVAVSGDLDRAAAPRLLEVFEELAADRAIGAVTVDLRAVSFMDSGGLRVLLDARHSFRDGFVVLAAGRSRDLLEVTGCHRFLEIRY